VFAFLNKNRQVQKPLIEAHNGIWIKEPGDRVMANFQAVSVAVNAVIKKKQPAFFCLKAITLNT
jgi:hypothetical protein